MSGSSVEELNEKQARIIITELVRSGADRFVIAPGSRSTPLVLAALENPMANTCVHFDERSAGFYAYGVAKASRKPVCVIVTSGTALANLSPAVAEAEKDAVPLIIISADRPPELHDCGANQTMKQEGFFGSLVKDEVNITPAEPNSLSKSLPRRINLACYKAMRSPMGPIHMNVMIREPLFNADKKKKKQAISFNPLPETQYLLGSYQLPPSEIEGLAGEFSNLEKGLIIVGELANDTATEEILALAMKLQWPVFADPSSGLRSLGRDTTLIPFYNHILQTTYSKEKMVPELILYLGGPVVSKSLSSWVSSMECKKIYHVINSPCSQDSIHAITHHIEMKEDQFCSLVHTQAATRAPSYWLSLWKEYSLHTEEILKGFMEEVPELTEPYTIFSLLKHSFSGVDFFFSNSLPVRYADSFLFPEQESGWIYTKRGLSGIDGVLSMAIGVADHTKRPMVFVIGDVAFLHDLTALALLKEKNLPITIVLLNNGGGGIFHFLPIAQKDKECDDYWVQKHDRTFSKHVESFNIPYFAVDTKEEYEQMVLSADERVGPCVIEVASDAKKNFLFHKEIEDHLKKRMMRSKKEKELCYFALNGR